jgi:hypothetical protein
MAMSPFTAQALMKAIGGAPSAPIDNSTAWNPAANIGQAPSWGHGSGKGGASASAPASGYSDSSQDTTDTTGNGVARGAGVTQAQVDRWNRNPYQRDASTLLKPHRKARTPRSREFLRRVDSGNQPVPEDIRASIERLRKAGL